MAVPAAPCAWCGRALVAAGGVGRHRRYCTQSCRQRAYEQRQAVRRNGLPADAVVLSGDEATGLADRVFQLRCAAEDLMTAMAEGAEPADLRQLGQQVVDAAHNLERLRAP